MTTNKQITICLDLGDRRHAVCILDAAGQILAEDTIPNTRECLAQLGARYPGAPFPAAPLNSSLHRAAIDAATRVRRKS